MVREYLLHGESVRLLELAAQEGRSVPRLTPAQIVEVRGPGSQQDSWRYALETAAPEGSWQSDHPATQVLHFRRAPTPAMPWRGRSVLTTAPALSALAGMVDRSLLGEHAVPSSRVMDLRIAWRQKGEQKQEQRESLPLANLVGDGTVQVQQLDRGMEAGGGQVAQRIGAEPSAASVNLRAALVRDVQSAFGVPPGLLTPESGSAQSTRELRSLFLRARVTPLLEQLAAELSRVFNATVSFRLPLLDAERADAMSRIRQRRASTIAALVRGGMSLSDATALHDGEIPKAQA